MFDMPKRLKIKLNTVIFIGFGAGDFTVTIMGGLMAFSGMTQGLISLILILICSQAVCGIRCMVIHSSLIVNQVLKLYKITIISHHSDFWCDSLPDVVMQDWEKLGIHQFVILSCELICKIYN